MCQQAFVPAVIRHQGDLGNPRALRLTVFCIIRRGGSLRMGPRRAVVTTWLCKWNHTGSVIRGRLLIHHLELGMIIVPNYWVVVSIK